MCIFGLCDCIFHFCMQTLFVFPKTCLKVLFFLTNFMCVYFRRCSNHRNFYITAAITAHDRQMCVSALITRSAKKQLL